jgi:hypothetical protein
MIQQCTYNHACSCCLAIAAHRAAVEQRETCALHNTGQYLSYLLAAVTLQAPIVVCVWSYIELLTQQT